MSAPAWPSSSRARISRCSTMPEVRTISTTGTRTALSPILPRFVRSEEHTSELQSLMRISYAVFCLKTNKKYIIDSNTHRHTSYHKSYTHNIEQYYHCHK